MIKKLSYLSMHLRRIGLTDYADKIKSIATEISGGEIISFDWITQGNIFGNISRTHPAWFEAFLELNADLLMRILDGSRPSEFIGSGKSDDDWRLNWPSEFIGSGKTGDAWRLSDGRVLKIFDENANVMSAEGRPRSSITDYKEVEDAQWSMTADASQPNIYKYGLFELPSEDDYGIEEPKSPTDQKSNPSGVFKPGYAIMEGVRTISDTVNEYLRQHPELNDIDSNEDISKLKNNPNFIQEQDVPNRLIESYDECLDESRYKDFLDDFMSYMKGVIGEIINDMVYDACGNNKVDNHQEIEILVKNINKKLESGGFSKSFNKNNLAYFERVLNLPKDWVSKLVKAMINNMKLGRTDIHMGNWGFRGDQPVFFDA
jgi:hypothetical protein